MAAREGTPARAAGSAKSVAEKMLLKPGQAVLLVGASRAAAEVVRAIPRAAQASEAAAALLFALGEAQAASELPEVIAQAAGKRLWVAYPKAGQLGTDLNRDRLHRLGAGLGLDAVRQIALDEVWSALAFTPLKP